MITAVAGRFLRRVLVLGALCVCAVAFLVQDACILAEPSGALPRLPEARPTIVHASLVPRTSAVLTRFPAAFEIPVELTDPTATIAYALFIDYNPFTNDGLVQGPLHSDREPNAPGGRRVLTIGATQPPDLDRCHVIEVVVALRFSSENDSKGVHTPAEPGGDIATWIFSPNGDLAGCPSVDAGFFPPSDAEAGEGGVQ